MRRRIPSEKTRRRRSGAAGERAAERKPKNEFIGNREMQFPEKSNPFSIAGATARSFPFRRLGRRPRPGESGRPNRPAFTRFYWVSMLPAAGSDSLGAHGQIRRKWLTSSTRFVLLLLLLVLLLLLLLLWSACVLASALSFHFSSTIVFFAVVFLRRLYRLRAIVGRYFNFGLDTDQTNSTNEWIRAYTNQYVESYSGSKMIRWVCRFCSTPSQEEWRRFGNRVLFFDVSRNASKSYWIVTGLSKSGFLRYGLSRLGSRQIRRKWLAVATHFRQARPPKVMDRRITSPAVTVSAPAGRTNTRSTTHHPVKPHQTR